MNPFVGRDRELAWLRERMRAEAGSAVLVAGEAGVGKSRLVNEALAGEETLLRIAFPGARFAAPGLGLRRLLELGGPEADTLEAELTGPEAIGAWKLASICRATDALLGARAPGIVALDDLQWADELTLAWLSQAADLLESAPIRLVLVVRAPTELPRRVSSAVAPLRRRRRLESLTLDPLDEGGVGALASSLGYPVTGSVAERLLDRSDGLPLAVEEIVRSLLERGRLPSPDTDVSEVGVPGVVAAVVQEELEALPA
ncbi:MAG TPA: AAA family ATPase, partial [Actinomycetota bacterium]